MDAQFVYVSWLLEGENHKNNVVFVLKELIINIGGLSYFWEHFIDPLMHTQRCQRTEIL